MAIQDTINNWVGLAEYDFDTAGAMLKTGRYLYVAFTCQQCIEKTLKALYVKEKLATPPYTHNLPRLLNEITLAQIIEPEKTAFITDLNSYYIEGRYTEHLNIIKRNLNLSVTTDIYNKTEILFTWLKRHLI